MVLRDFMKSILFYFHWLVVASFPIAIYIIVRGTELMTTVEELPAVKYDFIIVGGGSAGAILAARLSEIRSVTVLLIEAGVRKPSILNIPALGPLLQRTEYDWQYKTIPQNNSCLALNENRSLWASGKVLGGSTHLNYMMYVPGHIEDFTSWKDPTSHHWNHDDIKYYFDKSTKIASNGKGCMAVSKLAYSTKLSDAILDAAAQLNYTSKKLGEDGTGFMKPRLNLNPDGSRWTADQCLDSAMHRPNLKVLTHATVDRVLLLNGFEAVGVEVTVGGVRRTVLAAKEVVLSAGTVGSAKVLMLSGIGPRDVLAAAKVAPLVELPVGRGLQDHVTTGLDLILLNRTVFSMSHLTSPLAALDYWAGGGGAWTTALCEAVGLLRSRLAAPAGPPDLELMVMVAGVSSDGGLHSRRTLGLSDEAWDRYYSHLVGRSVATILPVALHPRSVGQVRLDPSHPRGPPLVDPNYLGDPRDVDTLVEGVRIVRRLVDTPAMREFGATFNHAPFPGCDLWEYDSRGYWECYVRHVTLSSYHPIGSCRMGAGMGAVVDHSLRVRKTNKLRVVDASVLPTFPSGNTNAAVVMVAEKAADLIKEALATSSCQCCLMEIFLVSKLQYQSKCC